MMLSNVSSNDLVSVVCSGFCCIIISFQFADFLRAVVDLVISTLFEL